MKVFSVLTICCTIVAASPLGNWAALSGNDALELRLIKLGPQEYSIISELEKVSLRRRGKKFMDVTNQISIEEAYTLGLVSRPQTSLWKQMLFSASGAKQIEMMNKPVNEYKYPKKLSYKSLVRDLNDQIDKDSIYENLSQFTSFYTRYYKSKSGAESSDWLYEKVNHLTKPISKDYEVNITRVHHKGWDQTSLIVSIPGNVTDKVVVGAHQDSIHLLLPQLRAPGADDDGSGTVTTLEALRLVVQAISTGQFSPYNTLEFHYYSAEEGGLLGSADVFARYYDSGAVVLSMLQQDMTGYSTGSKNQGIEEHLGLITDYTNVGLNGFLKLVIDTYNDIPYHETECGYACSDHASALENGYPSAFIIESEFKFSNQFIHSSMDTIEKIDFDHVAEHVKLTVGYAIELSGTNILNKSN